VREKTLELHDLRLKKDDLGKISSRFNLNTLKSFGLKKLILLPDFCPGKSYLPVGTVSLFDRELHTPSPPFIGRDIGCGMSLFQTDLLTQDLDLQHLVDHIDKELTRASGVEFSLGKHFIDLCQDENGCLFFVIHAGFKQYGMHIVNKGFKGEKYLSEGAKNVDLASLNRLQLAKAVYRALNLDAIPPLLDKPHNTVQKIDQGYLYRKGAVELFPDEYSILPSNLLHPIFLIKGKRQIRSIENSFSHGTVRKASIVELEHKEIDYTRLREQIKMPKNLTKKSLHKLLPTEFEDFYSFYSFFEEYISIEKSFKIIGYLGYKHS
jgi:RNA-splicing ligase RtcB